MAFEKIVKISSKGRITLPKAVRDLLKTDMVRIVAEDNKIRIEPADDLGGSLNRYAEQYVPLAKVRQQVWGQVRRDKSGGS